MSHSSKEKRCAALLLSAGFSSRMGTPKALLKYGKTTFIEKLIADYQAIGCSPVVVIVGVHANEIQTTVRCNGVKYEVNLKPARGAFSSLQTGLKVISEDQTGFFFCPVDHPAVKRDTLKQMLERWDNNSQLAIRPRYRNQGGHPVLLGIDWRRIILGKDSRSNMRELMRTRSQFVCDIPVTDRGVLVNVDTPDEYKSLLIDTP